MDRSVTDEPVDPEDSVLRDAAGRTYALRGTLGRGSFGEVRLAHMSSTGGLERLVALKLLRSDLDATSQPVERLRDEARLLGSLRHPVVLAAHDLVELDGRIALVAEYVEGFDLSEALGDGPDRMPPGPVLEVIEAVAGALHAAWTELGVVHRDVKPQNIRVGVHGNVKLLDFGVARSELMARSALTSAQMLVGTLRYMAPERFDPALAAEPASDVFALGAVLFEAIAGARFYGRLEPTQIMRLSQDAPTFGRFLDERMPASPSAGVSELLAAMLAFEPGARPTADEVSQRCEALVSRAAGQITLRRWVRERTQRVPPEKPDREPAEASAGTRFEPDHPATPPSSSSTLSVAAPETAIVDDPTPEPESAAARSWVGLATFGGVVTASVFAAAGLALIVVGVGLVVVAPFGGGGPSDEAPPPQPPPRPIAAEAVDTGAETAAAAPKPEPEESCEGQACPSQPAPPAPPAPCPDPSALESLAARGRLNPRHRECVRQAMRDPARKMTERDRWGRLWLKHAAVRCDRALACGDYERDQKYFLEEIGRYDAEMMAYYATHLSRHGCGTPGQVRTWAERALERRDQWRGLVHVERVDQVRGLLARAAYAEWQATPGSERLQRAARSAAREWLSYRVQVSRDGAEALELCASAAGSEAWCTQTAHAPAEALVGVTLLSVPLGARIVLDGAAVGVSPATVELPEGAHTIEMRAEAATSKHLIEVSASGPSRWTWHAGDDRWEHAN